MTDVFRHNRFCKIRNYVIIYDNIYKLNLRLKPALIKHYHRNTAVFAASAFYFLAQPTDGVGALSQKQLWPDDTSLKILCCFSFEVQELEVIRLHYFNIITTLQTKPNRDHCSQTVPEKSGPRCESDEAGKPFVCRQQLHINTTTHLKAVK